MSKVEHKSENAIKKQPIEYISSDPIQKSVGDFGWWQFVTCFCVCLTKFLVGSLQLSTIFLAPRVKFICANSTNPCDPDCKEHIFDRSMFTETIITRFDLVCDRATLVHIAESSFIFGILLGNVLFGAMSDRYGRRIPFISASILIFVFGVIGAFLPSFWAFVVFRFVQAMATGGTISTGYALIIEVTGVKWRAMLNTLYNLPFFCGHLIVAFVAYFIRDYRYIQFSLSMFAILFIPFIWLIPESPRWLLSIGRIDESIAVLEAAAIINKLPTDNIGTDVRAFQEQLTQQQQINKANAVDLMRTPNMRIKTFCLCFLWFVCGLLFYGFGTYSGLVPGNIFVNIVVAGGLEIPACLVSYWFMEFLGRRISLIIIYLFMGLPLIAMAMVPIGLFIPIVLLVVIGSIAATIGLIVVYLIAGETFPTVVRSVGIGICAMFARIGSMIAPFINYLLVFGVWIPSIIYGVMGLLCILVILRLPETFRMELPNTMEEGEEFGKKN